MSTLQDAPLKALEDHAGLHLVGSLTTWAGAL